MKNKSWKYPFSRVGDSRFDRNKDGELDYNETFWRDMYIYEMEMREKRRREEENKYKNPYLHSDSTHSYSGSSKYNFYDDNPIPKTDSEKKKNKPEPVIGELTALLLSLPILFGGLYLGVMKEIPALMRIIILFGSAAAAIGLYKSAGIMD